jgi:hypothetical protein
MQQHRVLSHWICRLRRDLGGADMREILANLVWLG